MSEPPVPIVRIDEWEMRRRFNEGDYVQMANQGILEAKVWRSRPADKSYKFPQGTLSQQVRYFDQSGTEVARTHRFLLPNGEIGASGMEDPKRIFKNGILYRLKTPAE